MSGSIGGFLVVDKPGGMTSRDVVNRIQRQLPRGTKIGHTGTLDPLATGVLVLCLGPATKLADRVQAMGKSYETRIRLGATSDTDDVDGTVTETPGTTPPTIERLRDTLKAFEGTIHQTPPAYSAVKVNGRRAYDLARRGAELTLTARPVTVYRIALTAYDWPYADVEIDCGKGTYVRGIARDWGQSLGVGGLVQTLRRTKVGPFTAGQGISIETGFEGILAAILPVVAIDSNGEHAAGGSPTRNATEGVPYETIP